LYHDILGGEKWRALGTAVLLVARSVYLTVTTSDPGIATDVTVVIRFPTQSGCKCRRRLLELLALSRAMAAPAEMTTLDFTGTFVMNKALSDPTDEILRLQGLSWWTRKAIGLATITLYVKHYKDDEGTEHIDIDQRGTGGIGSTELRTLNWEPRPVEDRIFGAIVGKSRRVKIEDVENEYLNKNWLADTLEHGAVESYVESDTPKSQTTWIANQIWGFADINGERRYVRRVYFTGPNGEIIEARLVYDYVGENK